MKPLSFIFISACFSQQTNHRDVAVPRGSHERRNAVVVSGVDICSRHNEIVYRICIANFRKRQQVSIKITPGCFRRLILGV